MEVFKKITNGYFKRDGHEASLIQQVYILLVTWRLNSQKLGVVSVLKLCISELESLWTFKISIVTGWRNIFNNYFNFNLQRISIYSNCLVEWDVLVIYHDFIQLSYPTSTCLARFRLDSQKTTCCTNHQPCQQASQPQTKTRCANNEILKIFTSLWQQMEVTPPRWIEHATMVTVEGNAFFFKCFGYTYLMPRRGASKKFKVAKDSAMLID